MEEPSAKRLKKASIAQREKNGMQRVHLPQNPFHQAKKNGPPLFGTARIERLDLLN